MKLKIWIALLAIYLIWGSTYLAIRYAVEFMPPFLMAGTRFLVSGFVLFVWRVLAGDSLPTSSQWRSSAVVGLLLLLGGNGLVSWAEQRVPSGIAALLIGTVPLFIFLMEAFRRSGKKPGWFTVIGLVIGFIGIVVLIGPAEMSRNSTKYSQLAIGALLVASLLWSIGSVFSKNADLPDSSLMGTGMEMLCGGAGLYFVSLLMGEWKSLHLTAVPSSSWLGLGYLILFGSMIGFATYAWLLRNAPVSLVSTYAYVNPVIAILLGAWIGHENINTSTLIAAILIIGSVIFINLSNRTKIVRRDDTITTAVKHGGLK